MSSSQSRHQRQLVRRTYIVMIGFAISALVICVLAAILVRNALQQERREPVAVLEGATVATLVELEGERAYPESITVGGDGYLYSGSFCTGELWRISPAGELELWVAEGIDSASGMAFAPDGRLYVIDHGDCDPRNSGSSIKVVAPDGAVSDFASEDSDLLLNALTFDGAGHLYALDTQGGTVLLYAEDGSTQTWWELPETASAPVPTGISFAPAQNALLIADSSNGRIYQVAIAADGSAGNPEVLYEEAEHELDGLTLDEQGQIIFTEYDTGKVLRRLADGSIEVLADKFRNPSDVAYLDGRVYVTNFDSVSLAPLVSLLVDPALPFTIDVITLPTGEGEQ